MCGPDIHQITDYKNKILHVIVNKPEGNGKSVRSNSKNERGFLAP